MSEKRYAIVIGSNDYVTNPLSFTIKDADDIANVLQTRCNFEYENIKLLKYEVGNAIGSIRTDIFDVFEAIKNKGFNKGMDTLFFYFSGHGRYNEAEEQSYIDLSDAEELNIQEILDAMLSMSEKNNYLIIDACHAGSFLSTGKEKGREEIKKQRKLQYNSTGIYILFSSKKNQKSYEPSEDDSLFKNGLLTHYFIKVLNDRSKYMENMLPFGVIYSYVANKIQLGGITSQIPVAQMQIVGSHSLGIWTEDQNIFNPHDVFFIAYKKEYAAYYHERAEDLEYKRLIAQSNVWVSGDSGWGKTNLIQRNTVYYDFCDMSMTDIKSIDDILITIIELLRNKYNFTGINESNDIKELSSILSNIAQQIENFVLVIDELGIADDRLYVDFTTAITNLTNHHNNLAQKNPVSFIVSTRKNPKDYCKDKSKLSGLFNFLPLAKWNDNDLGLLFEKIKNALKMNIEEQDMLKIIEKSSGNPRILKNILHKINIYKDDKKWTINKCIEETLNEHLS